MYSDKSFLKGFIVGILIGIIVTGELVQKYCAFYGGFNILNRNFSCEIMKAK